MTRAIREHTVVGPAGRVLINRSDLPEGSSAEVIVLVDEPAIAGPQAHRPLSSFVGAMKGQFNSPADVDAYIRELRDEWDRP